MILWDETERKYGRNESNTRRIDKVIVKCEHCGVVRDILYDTYKRAIKRFNTYMCHECKTTSDEFRRQSSEGAKARWQDQEYRDNNLTAVRSDEYRKQHRDASKALWNDPKYVEKQHKIDRSTTSSRIGKENWKRPEYRRRLLTIISDRAKRLWRDPEFRQLKRKQQSEAALKMWRDGRQRLLLIYQSKEFITKMTAINGNRSPETKAKLSQTSKAMWENEAYRRKMHVILNTPEMKEHLRKVHSGKRMPESDRTRRESEVKSKGQAINPQYNYSQVYYLNSKEHIKIICPLHGEFYQTPNQHISKRSRCPACAASMSKLQLEINDYVGVLGYNARLNDRKAINPYELDIYIADKSIGIEVDGLYWHSYNRRETTREVYRHSRKVDLAITAGIRLMCIREDEWEYKQNIVKSRINYMLGKVGTHIYARDCGIVTIKDAEYREFITRTHLQGYRSAAVMYGLRYNGILVAVISLNKHKKHGWEIIRYAVALNTVVVGGASKLFKRFVSDYHPAQVMTYADRRYATGGVYEKLGFKFISKTKPNYVYVKQYDVYSRQHFQKHKLPKLLEKFDPNLTEAQNMFNNGYRRLWDAGNNKYIWSGD